MHEPAPTDTHTHARTPTPIMCFYLNKSISSECCRKYTFTKQNYIHINKLCFHFQRQVSVYGQCYLITWSCLVGVPVHTSVFVEKYALADAPQPYILGMTNARVKQLNSSQHLTNFGKSVTYPHFRQMEYFPS